jgi:cell wall-associated NlpC family hydrolase
MSKQSLIRRVSVGIAVTMALMGVLVSAGSASGDPIANKRAEAAKVVDELNALQQQEEVIAEQYDNARIELSTVNQQEASARRQLAATRKTLASRQSDMAAFAVQAYLQGGTPDNGSLLLSSSNGTDASQRQGYADATQGRTADVVDRLRAAQAASDASVANLHTAQAKVAAVAKTISLKRQQAQAAVKKQAAIVATVKGQLATLVRQEEARRAAAAAKAAAAAQAKFLAQQAAWAAAHPNVNHTKVDPPTPAHNPGGGTTPPTTDPSTGGGGGGGVAPVGHGAAVAIAAAEAEVGVPYRWAGASPATGFDCSGLMMWAWAHAGVSLPHSSSGQYAVSQHIPLDEIQPGDLLFYGSPIHHVAMYIGGGQIIQAPHTGADVGYASMYYGGNIVGAGRV